jgi:predicted ATPase
LLALYDPEEHRSLALLYGQDPGVVGRCWLARCVFALGYPEQAMALAHQACIEARDLGHPYTTAVAHYYQCELCQFFGDRRGVLEQGETLVGLGTKHDFPFWLALGTVLQGWARSDGADAAAAITQIRDGLTAYWATGGGHRAPYLLALLAEAHTGSGDIDAALGALTEALDRVENTGERWFEAELHRRRGETIAQRPGSNGGDAEACLRRALAVARAQGAKMWELRAAISLARLWRDQGKGARARSLLAPLHDWFSEGFDTPDLIDASALLDELR